MTLTVAIACLATGSYALRASGLYVPQSAVFDRLAGPITAAILASLIVTNTATAGRSLTIDSRLIGLAAALIAIGAKRNLITVLTVSVVATAAARMLL